MPRPSPTIPILPSAVPCSQNSVKIIQRLSGLDQMSIHVSPTATAITSSPRIFGTGEMADLIRDFDWRTTPVGPIADWPETLVITVNTMLATRHPMFLWWGPELIQF